MNKLIKNISAIALAAGIAALPGAANAGTSTATGTANLTVTTQCSVTGANVNLGSYTTAQTWGDVGAALGKHDDASGYAAGSRGFEYLNWGSVTCDNAMPYTLSISGTASLGRIKMAVGTKTATFDLYVKKVGTNTVSDTNGTTIPGGGALMNAGGDVTVLGTGAQQDLLGSVVHARSATDNTAAATDALGTAGTYNDTLTYTLKF